MAQNVLDFRQAGAAIEQHAGLGVAEVMRGGRYAHEARVALDRRPDRLRPEAPLLAAVAGRFAAAVVVTQKQRRERVVACLQVSAYGRLGFLVKEDDPLLFALASNQCSIG